jgi:hypothetical protein
MPTRLGEKAPNIRSPRDTASPPDRDTSLPDAAIGIHITHERVKVDKKKVKRCVF